MNPSPAAGGVRASDLWIRHRNADRPAIQGVSFDLPPAGCLLVVGPSGSGKSTLALAIAGLIPRDVPGELGGTLSVGGRAPGVTEGGSMASVVGLVFQDPNSQLVMDRVEDDVAFGLENRGWARARMAQRVPEVLEESGLRDLARRRSNLLSGGQQQRLALAGVLAPLPPVLVLDEPTASLDREGAAGLFERLRALRASGTTSIILIEHRVEAAWPLADIVLALDGLGTPIDVGPPAEVMRRSGRAMAAAGIWLPEDEGAASRATQIARTVPVSTIGATRLVAASGVEFAFEANVPVLSRIDLELFAGERIALVGPNGSGKSTLGRLLVGLLRPTSGSIRLGGRDPSRLNPGELARRAGYVFQRPEAGFLTDTVAEEVALGLPPAGRRAAEELMERLRLPLAQFGPRSPYRLSGGEARRLSLACTLVHHPSLLVLDEPTFGQDRLGYDSLLEILRDRVDEGACLIAATHDERLVADVASRTIELASGRLVGGRPSDVAA